jgi:hypothetical protein
MGSEVTQAEHRNRYPDWQFWPGANAVARPRLGDGGGGPGRRGRMQAGGLLDRGGGEAGAEDADAEETPSEAKGRPFNICGRPISPPLPLVQSPLCQATTSLHHPR